MINLNKKNILFLVSDLESGGFQKSLISLLQSFNYEKYDVDLLVLCPSGIFLNQVPSEVNIISTNIPLEFFKAFPICIKELIKKNEYLLAIKRGINLVLSRIDRGRAGIYMSRQIPAIDKEYDVAIDYNGQHILYYMVDKIKAKKKISYFHSDYKKWDYYKVADKKYYPKIDYIVTISDICKESLDEIFPECKDKTKVIHNISSPRIITKLSMEECPVDFDKSYTNLVMVGRPSNVKGYDFAIEACKKLKNDGYKVRIYSVGTSNEISKFKKIVSDNNLEDEFIFLGETNNPYCIMKEADIYIHPSRFEGKSVAIDEAKILAKPIIISNFTTSKDHINNAVNGLIVGLSSQELALGIQKMIDDKTLREYLISNLKNENLGNEDEVEKLYTLID